MKPSFSESPLRRTGLIWFSAAVIGQGAFVLMILAFYGRRTLAGNFAGWNDKPHIKSYVPGDRAGNLMFALHVLLAAVVTAGGLLQLVPAIRKKWPALHRWNGRLFFTIAGFMAIDGLWLTWVRHTYLAEAGAIGTSADAVLILLFVAKAWQLAARRDFAAHRQWALRAFMVVNGVWFLRVGMMGWAVLTGGWGMNDHLSGPADLALQYGCYLIPLALLEVYFRARGYAGPLILAATLFMVIGIGGAIAFMWAPHMVG